jgi:precorrin-6A/cobalt-precorrin-6A reductase
MGNCKITIQSQTYQIEFFDPVYSLHWPQAQEFERIFLTIGSNNLDYFIAGISNWQKRLTARVLPDWKFIKKARQKGFTPANLLAIQGPFSRELNRILLK